VTGVSRFDEALRSIARSLGRVLGRLSHGARYEHCRILGHEYSLREGTFRHTPDYDDAWFLACARHATDVFDIGANVGYDAVLALTCERVRSVTLVEANPEALAIASDNIGRNGFAERARLVRAFAGDAADAEMTLWTTGAGAAGSMYAGHAVTAAARGEAIRVPTTTVDAIAARDAVTPDLVKIDVEGAEQLVLAGSAGLASAMMTRFLVEMHSNPDLSMRVNAQRLLDWCERAGYVAWYLKEHARLERAERIAHRGRCHVLLQPASWPYPEWLRGIEQSAPLARGLPA
jgi:FkbM family methyltransferase